MRYLYKKFAEKAWLRLYSTKARGPMLSSQHCLLRHPVPPLQGSMEKYLGAVRPHVSDDQFNITKKVVNNFSKSGGVGEKIHAFIEEKARNEESWIHDWWVQCDYLDYRAPLVIYTSASCYLPTQTFKSPEDQLKCAAIIINGVMLQRERTDNHQIEVEMLHGQPLDMNQYFKIYSSCRIPRDNSDITMLYDEHEPRPRHIVIIRNNRFFKINIVNSDGSVLKPSELLNSLKKVVEMSPEEGKPFGILTTQQRDNWAEHYKEMIKDPETAKSLEEIQRSIFIITLDKPSPPEAKTSRSQALLSCFSGSGSKVNTANRWYDKCIQFHVGTDGLLGFTIEHSTSEGYPIAQLKDTVLSEINNSEKYNWVDSSSVEDPQEIKLNTSPIVDQGIEEATIHIDKLIENTDVCLNEYKNYGSNFIKSQKLSPNSFVQMALQLGFYKLHGPTSIYEVVTARKFLHGRIDILNATSEDSIAFCKTMTDPKASKSEKIYSMITAINNHKNTTLDTINGKGFQFLLEGYKKAALELNLPDPELFVDPGYSAMMDFRVVTSQIPAKKAFVGVFAPRKENGYGLGFFIYPESIDFGSISFKECNETCSSRYVQSVQDCLTEMKDLLRSK